MVPKTEPKMNLTRLIDQLLSRNAIRSLVNLPIMKTSHPSVVRHCRDSTNEQCMVAPPPSRQQEMVACLSRDRSQSCQEGD